MAEEMIKCFKGANADDIRDFELDPDAMLGDVRNVLTNAGFLPTDDLENDIGFRFVAQQTESTNLKESLVGKKVEPFVPLKGVLGSSRQLILTNEYASHKPDLIGIRTDWCVDRNVSVQCRLNYDEGVGREANDAIGAFEPLMLYHVVPTSLDFNAYYRHVCVCVSGSVLEFGLSSWGAAGYEFFIGADRGEPIVSELYQCYGENPDRYGSTSVHRWQNSAATIRESTTIAPGKKVGFHKLVFRTRRVTSYKQGDRTYSSNTAPPSVANLQGFGPPTFLEPNVKPGHVIRGPSSSEVFSGAISNIITDDWTQALGEVVLYIFSFRTRDDAIASINGYNALVIRT